MASNSCEIHIIHHEKQRSIPSGLLQAISKVESGRKSIAGRLVAWPWTVNAQGQGYYFATKEAAIAAVQAMQFKGIKSIDVGCMQVNLYHHPYAFKNLSDAFEPAKNVAYAASFLTQLKKEHASWHTAVAHYHSANPLFHIPYRKTVLAMWRKENTDVGAIKNVGFTPRNRSRHLLRLSAVGSRKKITSPTKWGNIRRVTRSSPHSIKYVAYQKH